MNRQTQTVLWTSGAALAGAVGWMGWRLLKEKTSEGPRYRVLAEKEGLELRQYLPSLVAVTDVEGSFAESLNTGFHRLAGYIFGGNRRGQSIAMTVPVGLQRRGNLRRMTFVMPAGFSLEALPAPRDARVRLESVPPKRVAVRRFSGHASEARTRAEEARLIEDLKRQGLRPLGEPVLAQYNSPMVPPFLRHNEILIDVEPIAPVH